MGALVAPPAYASISDRINQAFQYAFIFHTTFLHTHKRSGRWRARIKGRIRVLFHVREKTKARKSRDSKRSVTGKIKSQIRTIRTARERKEMKVRKLSLVLLC